MHVDHGSDLAASQRMNPVATAAPQRNSSVSFSQRSGQGQTSASEGVRHPSPNSGKPRQTVISAGSVCPPKDFGPFPDRRPCQRDGWVGQDTPLEPAPNDGLGIAEPVRDFSCPYGISKVRHIESMGSYPSVKVGSRAMNSVPPQP